MKVVLAAFERVSKNKKHGFGFISHQLAMELHRAGLLGSLICLGRDADIEIPPELVHAMGEHTAIRIARRIISWLSRLVPGFNARLAEEILFDRFVSHRSDLKRSDLLFCSRPLLARSVKQARKHGVQVWIQASIPHPMTNYELVRNEEMRLDLPCRGPYSDIKRALRISGILSSADKILTPDREIGEYAYDDYLKIMGAEQILPLKKFFVSDAEAFADVSVEKAKTSIEAQVTFLHISHMNLIKGIPYLLDAWSLFKKDGGGAGCRLVLVGAMDQNIDELVRQNYSELPDLEMAGFVPDIRPYMVLGDVFISPSISDCGPGTISEAMGAGMPVISSRNCGAASLISEGVNGHTYPFNDVEALSGLLRRFSDNRSKIREMGRSARDVAAQISIGQYAEEIVGLIRSMADASVPAIPGADSQEDG